MFEAAHVFRSGAFKLLFNMCRQWRRWLTVEAGHVHIDLNAPVCADHIVQNRDAAPKAYDDAHTEVDAVEGKNEREATRQRLSDSSGVTANAEDANHNQTQIITRRRRRGGAGGGASGRGRVKHVAAGLSASVVTED